jgi:ABC-type antimicrobial peptide transport system permease subunit
MAHHTFPAGVFTYDDTPGPLSPALMDLPEIESSARVTFRDKALVKYEEKSIYQRAVYADASLLNILSIKILSGNETSRNLGESGVIISDKLAKIYFGDDDPLGKTLRVENFDAQIVGVFKELGSNSSVQFDLIVPYSIYAKGDQYNNEWGAWTGGQTYVKVHAGADVNAIAKKIHAQFTKPHIWVRWDPNVELFLLPLSDLRLYGNFQNGIQQGGRIKYVIGFAIVGGFILLIACINFINLATARSLTRAREIGVRKAVGAARRSLIKQFLGESIVISLFALGIALMLVHFLLPNFNSWTEKTIRIDYSEPLVYVIIIALAVVTGFAAGGYPAFLLSSFQPLNVLKGTVQGFHGNALRKSLVVIQFSLSVILIVSAIVVYEQIAYMRNKDLGFDRQNVFYFKTSDGLRKTFQMFRERATQSPYIENAAESAENPMEIFSGMVLADNAWPGKRKEDNVIFKYLRCDDQLLPLLKFKIVDGRNFSAEFPSDTTNYIINEEAARQMNLKEPVGQYIFAPQKGQIVGVIKDFHSSVLKGPIEPVIISFSPKRSDRVFIRYAQGHLQEAISDITRIYKMHEQDYPLELSFMDETFGRQYQDEIMLGRLSAVFTGIAVFVSGLGLFGLASFTAARRSKEIGVRKVMGATVIQMIVLLCKDFLVLVLVALMISLPISWWMAKEYLRDYAFRVELGISPFAVTSLSLLVVGLLTVAYQSVRAARSSPVRVLRSDH